jgi:hypothetical protein
LLGLFANEVITDSDAAKLARPKLLRPPCPDWLTSTAQFVLQMPDLRVVFLALKLEAEVLMQCPAFSGVSPVMVVFPSGFDVLREFRVAVVELPVCA